MKNKKLFAILTLVCFMFTLMPVAAFATTPVYAEVKAATVNAGVDNVVINVTDTAATQYYVVAYKDGAFYKTLGLEKHAVVDKTVNGTDFDQVKISLREGGNYEIYVMEAAGEVETYVTTNEASMLKADMAAKLIADVATVKMLDNKVTVIANATEYTINIDAITGLEADNGFTAALFEVELLAGGVNPVPGVKVNVYSDSYGLQITPVDEKTNAAGKATFRATATVAGDFNVYAEFAGKVESRAVNVGSTGAVAVKTQAAPTAPVNRTSTVAETGIVFNFVDEAGKNAGLPDFGTEYSVALVDAPAGVDKTAHSVALVANPDVKVGGYVLNGPALTVNGEYTFKVAMKNGSSATATVTVADFGKAVSVIFVDMQKTVAYNGNIDGYSVRLVDANGVTKAAPTGQYRISANGAAVKDVVAGVVSIKNDDELVGSKVSVMAVYGTGVNALTTVAEVSVVDQASTVKYLSNTAEVGVNNTLVANIVDASGKLTPVTTTSAVQIIVLDKPATAIASAKLVGTSLSAGQDTFKVDFLASEAGEYKIQTIVTGDGKYVSGIETITVGGVQGQFKDVVVVSLGADKMIVNSEVVKLDVAPFIENNRTMMQFNVLYVFGIDVEWVAETQSVVAEGNGVKVVMQLGSKVATVNGEEVTLDVAPYSVNGRTVVPVGLITGVLDITPTFTYNADGSIADILFAK